MAMAVAHWITEWFNEPESEGVCQIAGTSPPFLLRPGEGNHNASAPRLPTLKKIARSHL